MSEWKDCPGYVQADARIQDVQGQLFHERKISELEKQQVLSEIRSTTEIVKKMFKVMDDNHATNEKKWTALNRKLVAGLCSIIIFLAGGIVALFWKLPDIVSWLSTFVRP
jgi:hypothetical protein